MEILERRVAPDVSLADERRPVVLSRDAIAVLDKGWRRIVSEVGLQFAKPEAVALFAKAGHS